jgi:hypothetical protein
MTMEAIQHRISARYDTTEPKPSLLEQARLQHYYQYTSSNWYKLCLTWAWTASSDIESKDKLQTIWKQSE